MSCLVIFQRVLDLKVSMGADEEHAEESHCARCPVVDAPRYAQRVSQRPVLVRAVDGHERQRNDANDEVGCCHREEYHVGVGPLLDHEHDDDDDDEIEEGSHEREQDLERQQDVVDQGDSVRAV